MASTTAVHCSLKSEIPIQMSMSKFQSASHMHIDYGITHHFQNRQCYVLISRLPPKLDLRLQQQRSIKMQQYNWFFKHFHAVLEKRAQRKERLLEKPSTKKHRKKQEREVASSSTASTGKADGRRTHRHILQELLNVEANSSSHSVSKDEGKAQEDSCETRDLSEMLSDRCFNGIRGKKVNLNSNQTAPSGSCAQSRINQFNVLPLRSGNLTHVVNTNCDTSQRQNCTSTLPLPENKSLKAKEMLAAHRYSSCSRKHTSTAIPEANLKSVNCSTHTTTNCYGEKGMAATELSFSPPHSSVSQRTKAVNSVADHTDSSHGSRSTNSSRNSLRCEVRPSANSQRKHDIIPCPAVCPAAESPSSNDNKVLLWDDGKIIQRGWLERLKRISKAVQSEKSPRKKRHSSSGSNTAIDNNSCSKDTLYQVEKQETMTTTERPEEIIPVPQNDDLSLDQSKTASGSGQISYSHTQNCNALPSCVSRCEMLPTSSDDRDLLQPTTTSHELNSTQNNSTHTNALMSCTVKEHSSHMNQDNNLVCGEHSEHTNNMQPHVNTPSSNSGSTATTNDLACKTVNTNQVQHTNSQGLSVTSQNRDVENQPLVMEDSQISPKCSSESLKNGVDIQYPPYVDTVIVPSFEGTLETNEQGFVETSSISGHSECTMYAPTSQSTECDVPISPSVDTKDILSRVMTAVFFSDEDETEDVILSRTAVASAYKSLNSNVDFDLSGGLPPALLQLQTENPLSPSIASKTFYNGYCIGDGDITNMVQNLLDDIVTNVCHVCDSSSDSLHKKEEDSTLRGSFLNHHPEYSVDFKDEAASIREHPNTTDLQRDEEFSVNHQTSIMEFIVKDASSTMYGDGTPHSEDDEREQKFSDINKDLESCDDACSNNTDFVSLKLSSGYDTEEEETPRPPSGTSSMFHSDLVSDEEGNDHLQQQQDSLSLRSASPPSDIEFTVKKVTEDILNWIEAGQKEMNYHEEIPLDTLYYEEPYFDGKENSESFSPTRVVPHSEENECLTVYAGDGTYCTGEEDEGFMQLPCIESVYSIRGEVAKDFLIKSPCDDDTEPKCISYDIASPDGNLCWNEDDVYYNRGKRSFDYSQTDESSCVDATAFQPGTHTSQCVSESISNGMTDIASNATNKQMQNRQASTVSAESGENILDTWAAEMETEQHISNIVTHVMYSILKKCEDMVDPPSSERGHIPVQVLKKCASRVEKAKPGGEVERNKISLKFSLKKIQEMSNTKHVRKITRRMHRLSLEEEDEEHNSSACNESAGKDSETNKFKDIVVNKEAVSGESTQPTQGSMEIADGVDSNTTCGFKQKVVADESLESLRRTPSPFYLCYASIDENHVIKAVNCEENDNLDQSTTPSTTTKKPVPSPTKKVKDGLSKYIMSRVPGGKGVNDWKIASVKNPDLSQIKMHLLDKMADDVGKEFFFDQDETKSFKESAKMILTTLRKPQQTKKRKKKQKETTNEQKKMRYKKAVNEDAATNVMNDSHESEDKDSINEINTSVQEEENTAGDVKDLRDIVVLEEDTSSAGAGYVTDDYDIATTPATTDANSDEDGDYSPGVCSVAMRSELVARFLQSKRKERSTDHQERDLEGMLTRMRSLRKRGGNDVMAVNFDNPIPLEYKQTRRKRRRSTASEEGAEVDSKQKLSKFRKCIKKRRKIFTKTKLKNKFKHKPESEKVTPVCMQTQKQDVSDSCVDSSRRRKFFRSRDAYNQSTVNHQDYASQSKSVQPCVDKKLTPEANFSDAGLYDFDDDDVKNTPPSPNLAESVPEKKNNDCEPLKSAATIERPVATTHAAPDEKKECETEAEAARPSSAVEENSGLQYMVTSSSPSARFLSPPRSPSPEVDNNVPTTNNGDDNYMTDSADEGEGRLLIVVDTDEEEAEAKVTPSGFVKDTETGTTSSPELAPRVTSVISLNTNFFPVLPNSNTAAMGSNTTTVSSASEKPISSVVLPIVSNIGKPSNTEASSSLGSVIQPSVTSSSDGLVLQAPVATSSVVLANHLATSLPVSLANQPTTRYELVNQPAAPTLHVTLANKLAAAGSSVTVTTQPALSPSTLSLTRQHVGGSLAAQVSQATTASTWTPLQAHQIPPAGLPSLPTVPDGGKDCASQYERLKNELMMLEMVALQKERERNNILRLKQYKQSIMHKLQLKKSMMQGGNIGPEAAAVAQQAAPSAAEGRVQNLLKTMMLQQAALHAAASTASAMRQQTIFSTADPGSTQQKLAVPFVNPSALAKTTPGTTAAVQAAVATPQPPVVNPTVTQPMQDKATSTTASPVDISKVPLRFVQSQLSASKVDPATAALVFNEWKKRLLTGHPEVNSSLSSIDTIVAKANENFGLQLQDWLKEATRLYLEQKTQLEMQQQPQLAANPITHTMTSTSLSQPATVPSVSNSSGLPNVAAACGPAKRQQPSLDDVIRSVYNRRMNLPTTTALPATAANLNYVPFPVIRAPHQPGTVTAHFPSMTVTSMTAPNTVTAPIVRPTANLPYPSIPLSDQLRPVMNPANPASFRPVNKDLPNSVTAKLYNPPTTSTLAQLLMTPPQDHPERNHKDSEGRNDDVVIVSEQLTSPVIAPGALANQGQAHSVSVSQEPVQVPAASNSNWPNRTTERKLFPKWPQCQGCRTKLARFICAGCNNQWYCSAPCQVKHWKTHFKTCRSRR